MRDYDEGRLSGTDPYPHEKMMFQLALRRRGISDQLVLRAMEEVPRELFVDPGTRDEAYADTALPIACGQTISQPFVVAYMTEQLGVRPHHRVLEVGTGSGYQAAILSRLAREVISIERFRTLADSARARLGASGCRNVTVVHGDGLNPPAVLGTFDRIIITAAVDSLPQTLLDRLDPDGVLIAPVGPQEHPQALVRVHRTEAGFARQELIGVRFVPALPGVAQEL